MSKIRILIVEDEPAIAEHIAAYFDNPDFMVSGIAYDQEEAMEQLRDNTPDAAILDINLGSEGDGIRIAEELNSKYHLPFLFLTAHADKQTLDRAKGVNPGGYIVKPFNEKTLQASMEIAISNHARDLNLVLPPPVMEKINKYLLSPLSEREFEIAVLINEGLTNNQLAEKLFLSVNTIKSHLKSIYLKLDATSRYGVIIRLRQLMSK